MFYGYKIPYLKYSRFFCHCQIFFLFIFSFIYMYNKYYQSLLNNFSVLYLFINLSNSLISIPNILAPSLLDWHADNTNLNTASLQIEGMAFHNGKLYNFCLVNCADSSNLIAIISSKVNVDSVFKNWSFTLCFFLIREIKE